MHRASHMIAIVTRSKQSRDQPRWSNFESALSPNILVGILTLIENSIALYG